MKTPMKRVDQLVETLLKEAGTPVSKITEDQFLEEYQPIRNRVAKEERSWDGTMFETFGDELAFVESQPMDRVWTWVEGENGTHVSSGFHTVNRIGHFVTKKPFSEALSFEVETL